MNKTEHLVTTMIGLMSALALFGCDATSDVASGENEQIVLETVINTPDKNWIMIWNDEFDASAIDQSKWSFEVNCWGGGNKEQQCYTDRAKNAFIDKGVLNIVAQREDFTGPDNIDGDVNNTTTLPYTSARLRSMNKGDWTYGRFEIRAKLPFGQGTWPAIWMLPTDFVYGGWAASGEIDIMEAVNLKTITDDVNATPGAPETRVFGTLHYGKAWPQNTHSGTDYKLPNNASPADDFHTYAIEWEEGEIRWYVDNIHFATQRQDGWYSQYMQDGSLITAKEGAPFDQKFHLLLNLAVGGAWAGSVNEKGIDESVFPQTLAIDYVRVYQCAAAPLSGVGCASVADNAKLVEGHSAPEIILADDSFGAGPFFDLYVDQLGESLSLKSYDPDDVVNYQEVNEPSYGSVLEVTKTGKVGNLYFNAPNSTDLSHWSNNAQLVFDLKVESLADGVELLAKIDSGWPNASDYSVPLPMVGKWEEVRIDIDTLIASGNRFVPQSSADLASVNNVLVIEPTGPMSLKLDNIRYEYKQLDLPVNFEEVGYTVTDFAGNKTLFVADPSAQRGIVARTTKASNAQTWAGTTIGDSSGFVSRIAFSDVHTKMSAWVYSADVGTPVLFKVENSENGSLSSEVIATTTKANEWEQLIFDFSGLVNTSITYNKASIFFNFGHKGEEKVYYWDEIRFE